LTTVQNHVELSELAVEVTDGDHLPPPKASDGVPFITISDINKVTNEIDFSDTFKVSREYFNSLRPNKRPKKGDILYTVTGSFGIPVIVGEQVEFCFQRHIGLIRPRPLVSSKWLYYSLMSPQVRKQAAAGAVGTAQKTVALSVLRKIKLPDIPISQQERIASILDASFERLAAVADNTEKKGLSQIQYGSRMAKCM
jgi:type I restriction enzyme S subunit